MPNSAAVVLAAAMTAVSARPAAADVYYVTYTGTASGTDTNGFFGAAGAFLNGLAFTSTYTYDPSHFGNAHLSYTSSYADVTGGSQAGGVTDPILSAAVAINGHIYQQGSLYYGEAYVQGGVSAPNLQDSAFSSGSNYLENYGYLNGATTLSLTAIQSFAFLSGQGHGNFSYNGETIAFSDTYVSVTDGPPPVVTVSEPATLPLVAGAAGVLVTALGFSRKSAAKQTRIIKSTIEFV